MATEETLFFLDRGALLARGDSSLRVPASLDGLAVFEDVRCYRNAKTGATYAFRLDEHVKRLMRSMGLAMLDAPCTAKKLSNAVTTAVDQSGLAECHVRLTAYRAQPWDAHGGDPLARIAIACRGVESVAGADGDADSPSGSDPDAEAADEGSRAGFASDASAAAPSMAEDNRVVQAVVSSWRAIPVDSLPSAMRCVATSSVFALARQEAAAFGADEAVLLNSEGLVCQSTCGNVFIVRDGVLSTPPASSGAYDSVMRDTVLNLAMDMDVPVIEEQLSRADLAIADEAFLADDVLGIVPLVRIDGRQVAKGKPGAITKALQKRFAKAATGELNDYAGWLTEVK